MKTYTQSTGRKPDFLVRYKVIPLERGGRRLPLIQHLRCDFSYAADFGVKAQAWMVWPEFLSADQEVLPEGAVPAEGLATMWILDLSLQSVHKQRIEVGTLGFMVEGARAIAECQVIAVLGLTDP